MKCSVCGCENEDHVTVCAQCNAPLATPAAVVLCHHCGKQNRVTAKYCVYCGTKRVDVPAAAVASEPPADAEEPMPVEAAAETDPAPVSPSDPIESVDFTAPAEPAAAVAQPVPPAAPIFIPMVAVPIAPACQLPTERGFWKMFFLGILTAMLYPLVILSRISVEINMVASRYDGKRTIHFLWMLLLGVITLGIYPFVWFHNLCNRIGHELQRRNVGYSFGAGTFWGWNFLYGIVAAIVTAVTYLFLVNMGVHMSVTLLATGAMAFIGSIGPCIFVAKLMRAMNLMNADYNEKG